MIISGVIVAIVAIVAGFASLRVNGDSPRIQRSWKWIGFGCFIWAATSILGALVSGSSPNTTATFLFVGLVGFSGCALAGLYRAREGDLSPSSHAFKSTLLAGVVAATVSIELLIKPVLRQEFSSPQSLVSLVIQFSATMVLLSAIFTGARLQSRDERWLRISSVVCLFLPAVTLALLSTINSEVPAVTSWPVVTAMCAGFSVLVFAARYVPRVSTTKVPGEQADPLLNPVWIVGFQILLIGGIALINGVNSTIIISAMLAMGLLALKSPVAETPVLQEKPLIPEPEIAPGAQRPLVEFSRGAGVQELLDDLVRVVAGSGGHKLVAASIALNAERRLHASAGELPFGMESEFDDLPVDELQSTVLTIDSQSLSEETRAAWQVAGIQTVLTTPILIEHNRYGFVTVFRSKDQGQFDRAEIETVEQMVARSALAIQNAQLLDDARRRADERALLLVVSQAATSNLDLKVILAEIADATIGVASIESVSIELWDSDRNELVVAAQTSIPEWPGTDPVGTRFGLDQWPKDRIALLGRTPVSYNVETREIAARDREMMRAEGIGAVLLFPLWVEEQRIGLLKAFSRCARAFGPSDIRLGQEVSVQTAVAIHNARMLDAKKRQSEERALLLKVTQAATSSLDLHTVLAEIATSTLGIAGVECTAIEIWHQDTDELEIGAQCTVEDWPGVDEPGTRYAVGYWERERELLSSREPVRISLNDEGLDQPSRDRMQAAGTGSTLVIPLWIGDRCLGLLDLFSRSPDAFEAASIRICTEIASQTAVAINNAQLLQAENRRANEWAVLHRVSRAASSSLDVRRVLAEIAHAGLGIHGAECFTVKLWDGESREFVVEADVAVHGWDCEQELGTRNPLDDTYLGQLAYESQSPRIVDVDDPKLFEREQIILQKFGIKSLALIPIYRHDEIVGLFYLTARHARAFGDEAIRIGGEIARQTSLAIDNARLLDAEKKRNNDWAVLNRVSRAAVSSLDKKTVLHEMAVACLDIQDVDCCTIFSWDHERNDLVVEADVAISDWPYLVEIGSRFPLNPGAAEYAAMQRRIPIIVRPDNPDLVESDRDILLAFGMQSLVIAPIWLSDEETGFIYFASKRPGVFGEETTNFASEIASQVVLAFNNARLLEVERERSNERSILLQVSQAATSSLELDVVLEQIARASLQVEGVESCDVMLWRADSNKFEIGVDIAVEDWPGTDERGTQHRVGERSVDFRILNDRKPLVASRNDPRLSHSDREELDRYDAASFAFFPLWIGDQPIGVLEFYSRNANAFPNGVVRIGGEIAAQTALAIQNARLLQESRRFAEEQFSLLQVSRAVSAGLDLIDVMNEVALASLAIAGAECCEIELLDDELQETEVVAVQTIPGWELGTTQLGKRLAVKDWPLTRLMIASKTPLIVDRESPLLSPAERKILFTTPESSILILPMVLSDRCLGLVYCYASDRHAFSNDSIRLGLDLATQAGMAIERKRLLAALESQASTDGLTGLFNHRAVQERLDSELSLAYRRGSEVAVLMVDLNDFKEVNDTYGHQTGDLLLKRVAHSLRSTLRGHDVIGRYGGDEFMIILPDTDLIGAMDVAQRLKDRILDVTLNDTPMTSEIGLSTGFAVYPTHGRTRQELVEAADQAMYLSKRRRAEPGGSEQGQLAPLPLSIDAKRSVPRLGRRRPALAMDHLGDKPAAAG